MTRPSEVSTRFVPRDAQRPRRDALGRAAGLLSSAEPSDLLDVFARAGDQGARGGAEGQRPNPKVTPPLLEE